MPRVPHSSQALSARGTNARSRRSDSSGMHPMLTCSTHVDGIAPQVSWGDAASYVCQISLHVLQVRCWEIQANGSSVPKAAHSHEQPVLCSAWNADGATVYSGGCDNSVKAWNLATNQQQVVVQQRTDGCSWHPQCLWSSLAPDQRTAAAEHPGGRPSADAACGITS